MALLVAVAMVGLALFVRGRLDDDGGSESGGRTVRVLCSSDLDAACDELAATVDDLDVAVEPAGTTAERLVALSDADVGDLDFDAWLVPAPWPEMVRGERERAGLAPVLDEPTDPVARSPLVLAVWNDRAEALAGRCGKSISWRCIGDVAGTDWADLGGEPTWGAVKPGHGDPTQRARGLLVAGQAATDFFGTREFSRADLETDEFRAWFSRLEGAVPTFDPAAGSPFEQMLVAGPAAFDVVGTTESQAGPSLAAAAPARRDALSLLYPAPVATADLVVVPSVGGRSEAIERLTGDEARRVLAEAGWRVEGVPPADGVASDPPLPSGNGMPEPGVLRALQTTWQDVVR